MPQLLIGTDYYLDVVIDSGHQLLIFIIGDADVNPCLPGDTAIVHKDKILATQCRTIFLEDQGLNRNRNNFLILPREYLGTA